ncbi:MAG: hypothetical protein EZS28_022510, partial [Streblomastix strix]
VMFDDEEDCVQDRIAASPSPQPYQPILSFNGEQARLGPSSDDDSELLGSAIFEQFARVFDD